MPAQSSTAASLAKQDNPKIAPRTDCRPAAFSLTAVNQTIDAVLKEPIWEIMREQSRLIMQADSAPQDARTKATRELEADLGQWARKEIFRLSLSSDPQIAGSAPKLTKTEILEHIIRKARPDIANQFPFPDAIKSITKRIDWEDRHPQIEEVDVAPAKNLAYKSASGKIRLCKNPSQHKSDFLAWAEQEAERIGLIAEGKPVDPDLSYPPQKIIKHLVHAATRYLIDGFPLTESAVEKAVRKRWEKIHPQLEDVDHTGARAILAKHMAQTNAQLRKGRQSSPSLELI